MTTPAESALQIKVLLIGSQDPVLAVSTWRSNSSEILTAHEDNLLLAQTNKHIL